MSTARGLFVNVLLEEGCTHQDGCGVCVDACPVDIFAPAQGGGPVTVQLAEEDECILCGLCVQRCPSQVVRIVKLYERGA